MTVQIPYPQLGRRSLRTEALAVIRDAILSGRIKPGERITESELARQMGVSRAPIREALSWLEQEGLVTNVAHRGCYVAELPEEEIEQAYQLRALLEGFAIRKAVQRVTPAAVASLQGYIDRMQAAAATGDADSLIANDMGFHQEIIGLSGYRMLMRIWSSLDRMIRLRTAQVLQRSARPDIVRYTVDSHYPLLDAFVRRDPVAGEAAAKRHISEVHDLFFTKQELQTVGKYPGV